MFITVKLLNGYDAPLTYKVPAEWDARNLVGKIVVVPIQKRIEHALIYSVQKQMPTTLFIVREALNLETLPDDATYHAFIKQLSYYCAIDPLVLYKRMASSISDKEYESPDFVATVQPTIKTVKLTDEQRAVVDFLKPHIITPSYQPTLLHGVTGSGKTEVYKELIKCAYEQGKSTLLLLPEVSLAVNFAHLLRTYFDGTLPVYSFHSATPAVEKRMVWQSLLAGKPMLLIGVHIPLLLPIAHLGCIIVDEEHEVGFQEKKHPRINTKEAAIMRAKLYNIPILLGSATPSMNSLYNVTERGWHYFQLKHRFSGAFPKISLVKLSPEEKRYEFWISKELHAALLDRMARGEQSIIFINRRGYSFFVQCSRCSFIFSCKNCSVSLTYHQDNQKEKLLCHYCDLVEVLPSSCSSCAASSQAFLKKGIGTQQVVTILERLFPNARIGRADADSTKNKKRWQQTMHDFHDRKLDILVGTQTITKGYHFPHVTLVGILWAELNLNIPAYNAAETTLQQLIQVAGRAGRASDTSEVIVQTFSEHQLFNYVTETSYRDFYTYEMAYRKELNYPPYVRFAEIELRGDDETIVDREARHCVQLMEQQVTARSLGVTILGPSKPPVHKIKNVHMRRIYVKSSDIKQTIALFKYLEQHELHSSLFFTPNPV